MEHDKCWLEKKGINTRGIKTYYLSLSIDSGEPIQGVIEEELAYFFDGVSRVFEREEASLIIELNRYNKEIADTDGFCICTEDEKLYIRAHTVEGLLYGVFDFILMNNAGKIVDKIEKPAYEIRMINHWDNLDGTVERGYAGRSIFFEADEFIKDKAQIKTYIRLLASTGINTVCINNVNVHYKETFFTRGALLEEVGAFARLCDGYAIQVYLCVNFAAPVTMGELETADPLDARVIEWWEKEVEGIYDEIPNFGGFVVKADSEGREGPFTYGRTHTDGANMLARVLKPHEGLVFWRCFVYNCQQDWRDRKTDRAKAAYEHFMPLDGEFDENVILQIKHGPMDFQVREPVSPLFGALQQTKMAMEFQIAHEYTGQAQHIFYLPTMWEEILQFDTYTREVGSRVNQVIDVITAVVNVGRDYHLTGHKFSQANLYAYGKLTWNPKASAENLAKAWVDYSFDISDDAKAIIVQMLLSSARTYENYTAPLGLGWMVENLQHYMVDVNAAEYREYGTYHFSDRNGLGVDRTIKTGSGYARQYADQNFEKYNNLATCPDELLLFFHHVPYDYVLHSGKTVIAHIYDTHFEGVEQVKVYQKQWEALKSEVDERTYHNVKERLSEQLRSATDWRDHINTYYYRFSGVEDEKGRLIYR